MDHVHKHLHKQLDKAIAESQRGAWANTKLIMAEIIGALNVQDLIDPNLQGLRDIAFSDGRVQVRKEV